MHELRVVRYNEADQARPLSFHLKALPLSFLSFLYFNNWQQFT